MNAGNLNEFPNRLWLLFNRGTPIKSQQVCIQPGNEVDDKLSPHPISWTIPSRCREDRSGGCLKQKTWHSAVPWPESHPYI